MAKSERQARIRVLADRYGAATGQWVYQGRDHGALHYFSNGVIFGDEVALQHMINLCQQAGVPCD